MWSCPAQEQRLGSGIVAINSTPSQSRSTSHSAFQLPKNAPPHRQNTLCAIPYQCPPVQDPAQLTSFVWLKSRCNLHVEHPTLGAGIGRSVLAQHNRVVLQNKYDIYKNILSYILPFISVTFPVINELNCSQHLTFHLNSQTGRQADTLSLMGLFVFQQVNILNFTSAAHIIGRCKRLTANLMHASSHIP